MDISAYLDRIGYAGSREPTLDTLKRIHRAHLLAIPYENLDLHLGRTLSLDEALIFDKLVTRRRGGWCYEMNGLLAWALGALGYSVTRLASAVNRQEGGANADRNHLILRVDLDEPYLLDVGFGNGLLEPIPLRPGVYEQDRYTYRLEREGDLWQFHNQQHGGPGFEFTLEPRSMDDFAERCHYLQTSPESGFVRTTVCHRFIPDGIVTLRGAVLTRVTADGTDSATVDSEAEYTRLLRDTFGLDLPDHEIATLWHKVWTRHQEWLQEQAGD